MGTGASASQHCERGFDSLDRSSKNSLNVPPGRMRPEKRQGIVNGWRKRVFREQLCAVVRHGERSDAVFSEFGGGWTDTPDFKDFPVDPPLSQHGLAQGRQVGEYLAGLAAEAGATFHIVVASPYRRCVQTAVEICRTLGAHVPLLLDNEVGEIYGPSIMGEDQPQNAVRPWEHTKTYCAQNGVQLRPHAVGHGPIWPETVRAARERFVRRYLKYMQRSLTARRNFIIVTHGDHVATGLSVMPTQAETTVERVDFCGCFLARRQQKDDTKERRTLSAVEECPHSSFLGDANLCFDGQQHLDLESVDVGIPEGWVVETKDLKLQRMPTNSSVKQFGKRVRRLSQPSRYTWNQVQQLLGSMPEAPLSFDNGGNMSRLKDQRNCCEDDFTYAENLIKSTASLSTYLFGASEVGSRVPTFMDLGSPNPSRSPTLENVAAAVPTLEHVAAAIASLEVVREVSADGEKSQETESDGSLRSSSSSPNCNRSLSPANGVSSISREVQKSMSPKERVLLNNHPRNVQQEPPSLSTPTNTPEKKEIILAPMAPLTPKPSSDTSPTASLLQRRRSGGGGAALGLQITSPATPSLAL